MVLIPMLYCLPAVQMKLCLGFGLVFVFALIKIKRLSCLCDKFPKEICSDIESN